MAFGLNVIAFSVQDSLFVKGGNKICGVEHLYTQDLMVPVAAGTIMWQAITQVGVRFQIYW